MLLCKRLLFLSYGGDFLEPLEVPLDEEFDFLLGKGASIPFLFEECAMATVLGNGTTGVGVSPGGLAIAWVVVTGWRDDEILLDVICA